MASGDHFKLFLKRFRWIFKFFLWDFECYRLLTICLRCLLSTVKFLLQNRIFLLQVLSHTFMAVNLISQLLIFTLDPHIQLLLLQLGFLEHLISLPVNFVLLQHRIMVTSQKLNDLSWLIGVSGLLSALTLKEFVLPQLVDLVTHRVVLSHGLLVVPFELVYELALVV